MEIKSKTLLFFSGPLKESPRDTGVACYTLYCRNMGLEVGK